MPWAFHVGIMLVGYCHQTVLNVDDRPFQGHLQSVAHEALPILDEKREEDIVKARSRRFKLAAFFF